MLAPALVAQAPRRPRGIYAVVRVEEYVTQGAERQSVDYATGRFFQRLLPGASWPTRRSLGLLSRSAGRPSILIPPPPLMLTFGITWTTLSPRLPPGTPKIPRRLRKQSRVSPTTRRTSSTISLSPPSVPLHRNSDCTSTWRVNAAPLLARNRASFRQHCPDAARGRPESLGKSPG
jgi:hypothetical protein